MSTIDRTQNLRRTSSRSTQPPASAVFVLLAAMLGSALTGAVLVKVFLHNLTGARLDNRLMSFLGGPPEAFDRINAWSGTVSPVTVIAILAVTTFVAIRRDRHAVAAATVLAVLGATATTQVLKHGVFERVGSLPNSLPSGHTTAAMLWAIGAVLVSSRGWRPVVTVVGAIVASTIGVGTIAGRWHRPSDIAAAAAVCLGWAALAVLVATLVQRGARPAHSRPMGDYLKMLGVVVLVSCLAFFALGFVLGGQGIEQVAALAVLLGMVIVCAGSVTLVAWLADRELA